MPNILFCTTFSNQMWVDYAHKTIPMMAAAIPDDAKLFILLDDDTHKKEVAAATGKKGMIAADRSIEHQSYIERHKDVGTDYRKHHVRFCHKVFALSAVVEHLRETKEHSDYLVWVDADVEWFKSPQSWDELLPISEQVSYLGRKDWDHSECGFMAFNVNKMGLDFIEKAARFYTTDQVTALQQWHDSYVWDVVFGLNDEGKALGNSCVLKNLSEGIDGRDVWDKTELGKYSRHFKGNLKQKIAPKKPNGMTELNILPVNSRPDDQLVDNIKTNNVLIGNWVKSYMPSKKTVVMCAAGPSFTGYEVEEYRKKGCVIVACKNALKRIYEAGSYPDYVLLLDPRIHVSGFVEKPDTRPVYLVASQVDPVATKNLLVNDCRVYGWNALVSQSIVEHFKKDTIIVENGSASATRGVHLFKDLGYSNFILLGYDLGFFEKPDMELIDERGQPKYFEAKLTCPYTQKARTIWSEPQLLAQVKEVVDVLMKDKSITISAYGFGVIPWFIANRDHYNLLKHKAKGRMLTNKMTFDEYMEGSLWKKIKSMFRKVKI